MKKLKKFELIPYVGNRAPSKGPRWVLGKVLVWNEPEGCFFRKACRGDHRGQVVEQDKIGTVGLLVAGLFLIELN